VLEMTRLKDRARGFTLIELLISIAMIAITLALATPSFMAYQRNAELTAAVNSLVAGINAAKGEAMKRGRYVFVVPSNNAAGWASGWRVVLDVDGNLAVDATDTTVLRGDAYPDYLTITPTAGSSAAGATPYLLFDSSGYTRLTDGGFGGTTMTFQRNDLPNGPTLSETRRMMIARTGRVRSCKPKRDYQTNVEDPTCLASATN
jgi:type IV fimbrial biogenesis protein FimT